VQVQSRLERAKRGMFGIISTTESFGKARHGSRACLWMESAAPDETGGEGGVTERGTGPLCGNHYVMTEPGGLQERKLRGGGAGTGVPTFSWPEIHCRNRSVLSLTELLLANITLLDRWIV